MGAPAWEQPPQPAYGYPSWQHFEGYAGSLHAQSSFYGAAQIAATQAYAEDNSLGEAAGSEDMIADTIDWSAQPSALQPAALQVGNQVLPQTIPEAGATQHYADDGTGLAWGHEPEPMATLAYGAGTEAEAEPLATLAYTEDLLRQTECTSLQQAPVETIPMTQVYQAEANVEQGSGGAAGIAPTQAYGVEECLEMDASEVQPEPTAVPEPESLHNAKMPTDQDEDLRPQVDSKNDDLEEVPHAEASETTDIEMEEAIEGKELPEPVQEVPIEERHEEVQEADIAEPRSESAEKVGTCDDPAAPMDGNGADGKADENIHVSEDLKDLKESSRLDTEPNTQLEEEECSESAGDNEIGDPPLPDAVQAAADSPKAGASGQEYAETESDEMEPQEELEAEDAATKESCAQDDNVLMQQEQTPRSSRSQQEAHEDEHVDLNDDVPGEADPEKVDQAPGAASLMGSEGDMLVDEVVEEKLDKLATSGAASPAPPRRQVPTPARSPCPPSLVRKATDIASPSAPADDASLPSAKRRRLFHKQPPPAEYLEVTSREGPKRPARLAKTAAKKAKAAKANKVVMMTAGFELEPEQRHFLKKTLKVRLVDHFSSSVTHVIADAFRTSAKLMCAIAAGTKVLSSKYVDACMEAQRMVQDSDFLLNDVDGERSFAERCGLADYNLQAAVQKRKADGPLLSGVAIHCAWSVSGRQELKALVEALGGKWLAKAPHKVIDERRTLLLAEEQSLSDRDRDRLREGMLFSPSLLTEAACTQVLRHDEHRLKEPAQACDDADMQEESCGGEPSQLQSDDAKMQVLLPAL